MIFLTIVGSWTGAWAYDRRQKKLVQKKWCDLVRHLSEETLPTHRLQRKMTVFLAAPPADGVMIARDHFHEYVKPILVAAAMDWDAVEGRREGEVRAQLATRIRRHRKRKELEREGNFEPDEEDNVEEIRARIGVMASPELGGDLVIGRHTWKEYVRGLHEGWLGPLEEPATDEGQQETDGYGNGDGSGSREKPPRDRPHDIGSIPTFAAEKVLERATKTRRKDDQSRGSADTALDSEPSLSSESPQQEEKPPEEEKKEEESSEKKKKRQPPPFISTLDYPSASLPPATPDELGPSITIPFPHILGFRNTPIRMYRFLTRRYLADDIGRQVASAVLASYRPYHHSEGSFSPDSDEGTSPAAKLDGDAPTTTPTARTVWEQEGLLKGEEREWHKSVRKREDGEEKERTWLDPMVLDDRIAGRMRTFELAREEEERARRIGEGKEGPRKRVYDEE